MEEGELTKSSCIVSNIRALVMADQSGLDGRSSARLEIDGRERDSKVEIK